MMRRQSRKRFAEEEMTIKKAALKKRHEFNIKLFGRWDSNVEIKDPSLVGYINLDSRLLPRSAGVQRGRFHKSKMHIAERLALHLLIPGHVGKRHRVTSGPLSGNFANAIKAIENAFEIIEKKDNINPIEALVRAIENAAVREEIISYQLGSIMAREAVVTSPQRRVDKATRYLAQGAYRKTFRKKKTVQDALAEEITAAYRNSPDSFAIKERDRIESEAAGSR